MQSDPLQARRTLHLPEQGKIVALLPGSRRQELHHLLIPFIETAKWLLKKDPSLRFITACVNESREAQWKAALKDYPDFPITLFLGRSIEVMSASDAVLLASGTASLQSMLVKKPTVVAYKMTPLTFKIAKRIIKVKYISLPNILADEALMPEYIQDDVVPEKMGEALWAQLTDPLLSKKTTQAFNHLHEILRKKAGQSAANAIATLIKESRCPLQVLTKSEEVL
jgi:lipid-A-disaccharide synthase